MYLLQLLTVSMAAIFSSLSSRSSFSFIPAIHALALVKEVKCVHKAAPRQST